MNLNNRPEGTSVILSSETSVSFQCEAGKLSIVQKNPFKMILTFQKCNSPHFNFYLDKYIFFQVWCNQFCSFTVKANIENQI